MTKVYRIFDGSTQSLVNWAFFFIFAYSALAIWSWLKQSEKDPVSEAAQAASTEILRVVIFDDQIGAVGLVDGPKVRSINGLLAGVRQKIIASKLVKDERSLQKTLMEYRKVKNLATKLQFAIISSLSDAPDCQARDIENHPVSARSKGLEAYRRVCGYEPKTNLDFTLGWSTRPTQTTTRIPSPYKTALCDSHTQQNDFYLSDVNANVDELDFYFASVALKSGRVSKEEFRPADQCRISSCVSAEAFDRNGNSIKFAAKRAALVQ